MKVVRFAHHSVVSAWRERDRQLQLLGLDVTLVSALKWDEGGRLTKLSVNEDRFILGARTIGRHPSVFIYDPRMVWKALSLKPDLIDLHEEPNALATFEVLVIRRLRRMTTPVVLYSAQNIEKTYLVPFRWFERYALRQAGGVYVCNIEAGEILRRKGFKGIVAQIPLGVDLNLFSSESRNLPSAPFRVGYVGRLEPHKGVDVLIAAVAAQPDVEVHIVGDGSLRRHLESSVRKQGLDARIKFSGHRRGKALAAEYTTFDVVAVPSRPTSGWAEQFCRVAVEAMASGVPVVGSNTGAIADVVGSAGILVEPGHPQELEQGLLRGLHSPTWSFLRKEGLRRSSQYAWDKVALLQKALYEDVVLGGSTHHALPKPEVIIVAYGPNEKLHSCLDALGGAVPVTVIDNSSRTATKRLVESHRASYVDAGVNRGFAGGVNIGLEVLGHRGLSDRDVLLLNPDARISAEDISAMQDLLHSDARIGVVGASQVDPVDGRLARTWWPFPTPGGAWLEAVGLGVANRKHGFAVGSVLLLKATALASVGPFDEQFFLYSEETDWQRRATRLGWRIEVASTAATHEGAGTGGSSKIRTQHFYASAERYIRKHHGLIGWSSYRLANLLGAGARVVMLRRSRAQNAERFRLFLRGPARVSQHS